MGFWGPGSGFRLEWPRPLPEGGRWDKPLTLKPYECNLTTRAYIEPVAVGDVLPDMPLLLEPDTHVMVPLEDTYAESWRAMPARWRRVLEPGQP